MPDANTVKAKLRALAAETASDEASAADPSPLAPRHRETIETATAALDDCDAAAQFVETNGLDVLERAVEAAERSVSTCAEDGRDALTEYRRFRAAASGDQFHSARGTSLGDGDKIETR